ncbi:hypothetical protein B5M09_000137 [Aphanomyces astaci]|uniref:Uncharacterized protein n=1 Tax=Aphanomyces astaci TaxID=112090 RepID=A0A425D9J9_APHAT|nr:hypothetical protein B5M09_000137 [Aphanomyces astaci]
MSTLVLEPDFALAFAVLVGATAFAVPACLLLPSPLMRTTSWWRSSCSPLSFHCVYMVLPTLASYFASKVYLCVLFSNEDFVVSVYSARQVAVSASKDILIKLCPIVAMMQTMRNLIRCFGAAPPVSHALKLKKLPTMSTITENGELTTSSLATSILSSHTAALALGSFKRQKLLYGLRLNTNMLHDVHTRHVPNHADPAVVEQTRGRDRRHKQPHRAHASGCVGDSPSDALRIV